MMITTFLALWVAAQPASALLGRFFKPPASSLGKVRAPNPEIPLKTTGLPPMNTDNKGLQNIFYQNQAWKAERLADDEDFFNKLGSVHQPEFMYIGE